MRRVYHKWFSSHLQRDMELLEFGQGGMPVVVFPTSKGQFYQYEDNGMIAVVEGKVNAGHLHFFCVDSVDAESWYNRAIPGGDRVWRHMLYEKYIQHEVLPFIQAAQGGWSQVAVTGCSFGGFHSVNFALRHPDLVSACISMGGAYDLRPFMRGYSDQNLYFNQPLDFLPNLNDGWYWERYQKMKIVLATGERDICLNDNLRLDAVMNAKNIPHWLDVWGNGTGHDWHWWREMAIKFF